MARRIIDLDRVYITIRIGKYRGKYCFYKTLASFNRWKPDASIIEPWYNGQAGDWVKGDDGYIYPVLARSELKGNRNLRPTIVIRVPHASFSAYERRDGTISGRLEYIPRTSNKSSCSSLKASTTPPFGKHINSRIQKFAWLWLNGETPTLAYMKAFHCTNMNRAKGLAIYLIEYHNNYFGEIMNKYKQLFDSKGLDEDGIAEKIKDLISNARSGNTKIEAIKLALELRGELISQGQGRQPLLSAHEQPITIIGLTAPQKPEAEEAIFTMVEPIQIEEHPEAIISDDNDSKWDISMREKGQKALSIKEAIGKIPDKT